MLNNQIANGNRLYIFKDGQYQSWLNGREFAIGGYITNASNQGVSPASNLYIEDNWLKLSLTSAYNRVNYTCAGILLSDIVSAKIKRLGVTLPGGYDYSYSDAFGRDFIFSEKFVTSANETTALGTIQSVSINAAGEHVIDNGTDNLNYMVLMNHKKNTTSIHFAVVDCWIEV